MAREPLPAQAENMIKAARTAGRAGVVADDITYLTGIAPRTFRRWCEEHAGAFR
ncbi:hypothetical protein [Amycolatopsis pigmentata]|uniref:Helix-turn-helix domain-containing protein n=1 Tax=Amycolatopsis pigmentata TaxID=450801 RepID=A0ABW5FSD6_9PSEU